MYSLLYKMFRMLIQHLVKEKKAGNFQDGSFNIVQQNENMYSIQMIHFKGKSCNYLILYRYFIFKIASYT